MQLNEMKSAILNNNNNNNDNNNNNSNNNDNNNNNNNNNNNTRNCSCSIVNSPTSCIDNEIKEPSANYENNTKSHKSFD